MDNDYILQDDCAQIVIYHKGSEYRATIDKEDLSFIMVNSSCWHLNVRGLAHVRGYDNDGNHIYLHRFILQAEDGSTVDHIDNDPLNNRRSNLRVVSVSENGQNRKGLQRNNTSGVKGVYYEPERNKWVAHVKVSGKIKKVGRFDSLETAEVAVKNARRKFYTCAKENLVQLEEAA